LESAQFALVTATEVRRQRVVEHVEFEFLCILLREGGDLMRLDAFETCEVLDCLFDRQVVADHIDLGAVADKVAKQGRVIVKFADAMASDSDLAVRDYLLDGHAFEGCRLTGTVDTQECKGLLLFEAERGTIDSLNHFVLRIVII
jgi:hypothetical protein